MAILGYLLVLLGGVCAVLYAIKYCWRDPSLAKSLAKTGSTLALAVAGGVLGAPVLIFVGLAFGALGDYALSRPGERAFLAGMAAFATGHLAYAAVFLVHGGGDVPFGSALALLALAISTEFWLAPRTGTLRWPVRGYVVVISLMGFAALTLDPSQYGVALAGAGLFVLSDLLLATEIFVVAASGPRRVLSHLLWCAYWAGQGLILWGMLPDQTG
ncbi:MAG: lysoplasmalogenase [Albidovulum sp.]